MKSKLSGHGEGAGGVEVQTAENGAPGVKGWVTSETAVIGSKGQRKKPRIA